MALIRIVSAMNHPQNDAAMVREAGIALDRALFPLLVGVERLGPIGVVDLADRVGRDYTTVSRQVAKLDRLGLISRQPGVHDRRVRLAAITSEGKRMTDAIDRVRERKARAIFSTWDKPAFDAFVESIGRFADQLEHSMPALNRDVAKARRNEPR